eukprot:g68.t1
MGDAYHYMDGSIICIRVHNFLTFENMVLKPGPRLNMICGPNGSGKSSVVCAIALGLAGTPQVLGRSKKLGAFVKYGCDEAWVEIELFHTQGVQRIRRYIRPDNSSNFLRNEKPCTISDVKKLVSDLGIQVDNLCQFLPQDRVSAFANMSPQQMLKETELAVGGEALKKDHTDLESLWRRKSSADDTKSALQRRVDELQEQNERIKKDKIRMEAIERAKKRIVDLEKYLSVLDFHISRQVLQNLDNEYKTKKAEHQKALAESAPFTKKHKDHEKKELELRKSFKEIQKETAAAEKRRIKLVGDGTDLWCKVDDFKQHIDEADEEFRELENTRKARERKIEALEKKILEGREKFESFPEMSEFAERLKPIRAEERSLSVEEKRIMEDMEGPKNTVKQMERKGADLRRRIQRVQDQGNRKLQNVMKAGKKGKIAADAYRWLQKLKREGKFQGDVCGPLMMEVDVEDQEVADMMEEVITLKQKLIFAVETDADMKTFRNKWGNRLTITQIHPTAPRHFFGDMKNSEIAKQYGFRGYLDQFITKGSKLAKQALNSFANLDIILVGSAHTDAAQHSSIIDALQSKVHASKRTSIPIQMCTPSARLITSFSRYGNHQALTKQIMWRNRPYGTFYATEGSSATEMKHLREQIEKGVQVTNNAREELAQFKTALSVVEKKKVALAKKKLKVSEEKREMQKLKRHLENWQARLSTEKSAVSTKEMAKEAAKILRNARRHRDNCIKQYEAGVDALVEVSNLDIKRWQDRIMLKQESILESSIRRLVTKQKERFASLESAVKVAKAKKKDQHKICKEKCDEAINRIGCTREEITGYETVANAAFMELKNELIEELEIEDPTQLQETRETVTKKIFNFRQTSSLQVRNKGVLEQYRAREIEIQKATSQMLNVDKEANEIHDAFYNKYKQWKTKVKNIVTIIGKTFSENMKNMGFEGLVELKGGMDDGEEDDDPARFRIAIYVEFRKNNNQRNDSSDSDENGNEQNASQSSTKKYLTELSRETQSGGEKSVTTIMFLLSLQDITPCPFRLVDEINQGMDERNERKVFEQLCNAACQTDETPQTFLITPKLLERLNYPPGMRNHIVMNGMHVDLTNAVDSDDEDEETNERHDPENWDNYLFAQRAKEMRNKKRPSSASETSGTRKKMRT